MPFQLQDQEISLGTKINREISLYIEFLKVPYEQDPLKWWCLNCTTYPFLSVLAKKFLTIQATSVASEWVFSKGGLVVTDYRASLTNDHVSELVYLSMNKGHVPKPLP